MHKFVVAKNKAEVTERFGFDWYRIVRVEGGYLLFETRAAYDTWRKQK